MNEPIEANITTDNGEGVTIYYNPIIKIEWIMSED
jgi:hypothetical protein